MMKISEHIKRIEQAIDDFDNVNVNRFDVIEKVSICRGLAARECSKTILTLYESDILFNEFFTLWKKFNDLTSLKDIWLDLCINSDEWHFKTKLETIDLIKNGLNNNYFFNSSELDSIISGSLIFCFQYKNVGDVEIFLSLINNCVRDNKNRIILLVSKDLQLRLSSRNIRGVYFIFIDNTFLYQNLSQIGFRLQKGIAGHISTAYKHEAPWKFDFPLIYDGLNIRKSRLGIDVFGEIQEPIFSSKAFRSANLKFKNLGLKFGRTISIYPFSRALSSYGGNEIGSLWIENLRHFIDEIENKEYSVYLNADGNNDWVGAAKYLTKNFGVSGEIDLDEILIFSNLCGYSLSIRSGICDLLRFSDIDLSVIYPNQKELKRFGLSTLTGAYSSQNLSEHIIDFNNESTITNFFTNLYNRL